MLRQQEMHRCAYLMNIKISNFVAHLLPHCSFFPGYALEYTISTQLVKCKYIHRVGTE